MLDRARFPRDKPCGGGLTYRAVRQLPFSVEPVVEDTRATRVELGFRYGRTLRAAATEEPLILMTQRRRLDAFLAERAAARRSRVSATACSATGAGADAQVRDGALRRLERPRRRRRDRRRRRERV